MSKTKPNILLITTDQHRCDSLGIYGNKICQTPNLDKLANEGMLFDHAFTVTAVCTPARASLLTGLLPHNHKLLANFERNVGYATELDRSLIPFSHYLNEAGYRCANIGKWHAGIKRGPGEYGFEGSHYPGWCPALNHPDYFNYLQENKLPPFKFRDVMRGTFPNGQPGNIIGGVYEGPVEGTYACFLAERAIEKMKSFLNNPAQPFFLALHFFAPHLPYFLPESHINLYNPQDIPLPKSMNETFENKPIVQRHYAAHWCFDCFSKEDWQKIISMYWADVTLVDEQIGRVLRFLDDNGLTEHTAVFFTADHGAFVGSHKLSDKGPAMYDDIYRIPFITRFPGLVQPQFICSEFVSPLIDLTATFLDLCDIPVPSHFDGRSIIPLLKGDIPTDWRKEIYAEFHGHHFPFPQRMIRSKTHKLIINPADIDELYDLVNDPDEMVNQIDNDAYKRVKLSLTEKLYHHLQKTGDNFYHWMTSMHNVSASAQNTESSSFAKK